MDHRLSTGSADIVQAADLLAAPNPNRLYIDARLGEPDDERRSFRDSHILGAVYGQIRDVFAGEPTPESGNLPLPTVDALRATLARWRVNADTEIIVYGPSLALAARGWWVLRWAGLERVRVLDGGLKAWIANGGPLAQGEGEARLPAGRPLPELKPGAMPSLPVEAVEQLPESVVLIDARDEASFRAGAIPRAVNLPAALQWTPGSMLRTRAELLRLYAEAGVPDGRDVVVYCGGGVLSALLVLTLSALGIRPALYVGSWSEWCKSPQRMARSTPRPEADGRSLSARLRARA